MKNIKKIGVIATILALTIALTACGGGSTSDGGGEAAEQGRGDAGKGAADLIGAQAGLRGQPVELGGGIAAQDMAQDLAAVFLIGLGDLFGHGLGAGVLGQRAEQGLYAALGRDVVDHSFEQQRNGQGQQLFQRGAADAGLFGQRGDRAVRHQGLEQNT